MVTIFRRGGGARAEMKRTVFDGPIGLKSLNGGKGVPIDPSRIIATRGGDAE